MFGVGPMAGHGGRGFLSSSRLLETNAQTPGAQPLREEHRPALEALLNSRTFERCPRLKPFLRYIADLTIAGRTDEIKEQSIGCAVFGRPAGYDHAEDNIVRVTARQLRTKIDEYYRGEGKSDKWRIEIPRGSYVPVAYLLREPKRTKPEEQTESISAAPPPAIFAPVRGRPAFAVGAVMLVLCVFVIMLGRENHELRRNVLAHSPGIVQRLVPASGRRLNVVIPDSTVQLYRHLTGRDLTLNAYAKRTFLLPDKLPPEISYGSRLWSYLSNAKISDSAAVSALSNLLPVLPRNQIVVRHASEVAMSDFMHDSAILISSPEANPWVRFFEEKLNFQIQRFEAGQVIRSRAPKRNEPEIYRTSPAGADSYHAYCRVAMIPNLSGNERILLLSGPSAVSIDAAAAFVADPANVEPFVRRLQVNSLDQLGSFELVLHVLAIQGLPSGTEIASYRVPAGSRP